MESFVNFIKEYWQFIAGGLILVLEVFLMIIKRKKPEILSDGILSVIEDLVGQAESTYGSGHGKEKLEFVVQGVILSYPNASIRAIKAQVEKLLSLPQKKGVK